MSNLKERIGRKSPRWVRRRYRQLATLREFLTDYRDYATSTAWDAGSSGSDPRRDEVEALASRLTLKYHGLEKGMSFAVPKRPFGLSKIEEIAELATLASSDPCISNVLTYANETVEAVQQFNKSATISDRVSPFSNWSGKAWDEASISEFVSTRHSVRNFQLDTPVSLDVIQKAVEVASTTPSVCNRRSYRAHYFDSPEAVQSLLELQNGNAGFRDSVPGLFVVTERRSAFVGAGERNQRWIDGGLFSMTLVWALHAYGLGSCFLNWSQPNSQSKRLRSLTGIDKSEDIIVMIAVGHPSFGHRVARSPLRPITDTFVHHEAQKSSQ